MTEILLATFGGYLIGAGLGILLARWLIDRAERKERDARRS